MSDVKPAICFIGFGEAGQAIASGLREAGAGRMTAWDILFPEPAGERLRHAGETIGVGCASSPADAVREAQIVISAVTAAASVAAAQSVKAHLAGQPFLLDIDSVSPGRKQETGKLLGDSARYVDVAVLAPIRPARHQRFVLTAAGGLNRPSFA
jgi:3-hydroxyisobutyrate dehydrogenase-like beta-hydroxyacid dehydrogenase